MKGHSLTSGCSIPMLPPTDRQQQTNVFGNTRWRKRGPTNNASGKSNMPHLPLLFSLQVETRQGGNEYLQALGLQAGREVGPFLQPDHELVAMHLVICSTSLRNSVRSGCSLHSWPCRQGLLFACGSGISRGQHSTLLVTVFLVLILLPFSFPAILYSNLIFLFSLFLKKIIYCIVLHICTYISSQYEIHIRA